MSPRTAIGLSTVVTLLALSALPCEDLFSPAKILMEISDMNRAVRRGALEHLYKRLEAGLVDRDTIRAFLLAGLETDHVLRMRVDTLTHLIPPTAEPYLLEGLDDPRPGVRSQAAMGLGQIGPAARGSLERVYQLVLDEDSEVRTSAAFAIAGIDDRGSVLPRLAKLLTDDNPTTRHTAAMALDRFGERVRTIAGNLLAALDAESDLNVRYWLVVVLGNLMESDPRVVPRFVIQLKQDTSSFVRERVAREFWEMGDVNKTLPIAALESLVLAVDSDPEVDVRTQAAKAIARNPAVARQYSDLWSRCSRSNVGELQEICVHLLAESRK